MKSRESSPAEDERDPAFDRALVSYLSSIAVGAQLDQLLELTRSAPAGSYTALILDCAHRIQELARTHDLPPLNDATAELRQLAESMELARRTAFERLQQKIAEFQNQLREAERLAAIDPLTGVANRREFNRQVEARIAADRSFCILLSDLDQFKSVNDRYGHLYGDEVLRQLGARLAGQVRAQDFVCRWGGDEFVAILECAHSHAIARSHQIAQHLAGPYRVIVEGEELRVDISVSVGVAQHNAGETAEQLFQRVDGSMYHQKNAEAAG